ncbi:hypothetical protein [Parafrankia sp. CH37]|uniref:hypothetical protein n=1 Tax=Parafrankia sp. CH37 TaxID=683308 RepID=UPI002896EE69|nr:hypothetical protein [Parafrankia sp. CH37]
MSLTERDLTERGLAERDLVERDVVERNLPGSGVVERRLGEGPLGEWPLAERPAWVLRGLDGRRIDLARGGPPRRRNRPARTRRLLIVGGEEPKVVGGQIEPVEFLSEQLDGVQRQVVWSGVVGSAVIVRGFGPGDRSIIGRGLAGPLDLRAATVARRLVDRGLGGVWTQQLGGPQRRVEVAQFQIAKFQIAQLEVAQLEVEPEPLAGPCPWVRVR